MFGRVRTGDAALPGCATMRVAVAYAGAEKGRGGWRAGYAPPDARSSPVGGTGERPSSKRLHTCDRAANPIGTSS